MISKRKHNENGALQPSKKKIFGTLKSGKASSPEQDSMFVKKSLKKKKIANGQRREHGQVKVVEREEKQLKSLTGKRKSKDCKPDHAFTSVMKKGKKAKISPMPTSETEPCPSATPRRKKKTKKRKPHPVSAEVPVTPQQTASRPDRLSVAGGFSWDAPARPEVAAEQVVRAADSSSEDDSDEDEKQPSVKPSRGELRARAAAAELELQQRERRMLEPHRVPETADDHERLVVAQPDDSSLWIRYMAYFLQATEIEKARGVARRAVKTINFREEDEKLNVYVAWLNLESMHGTQETLTNVLHEALQSNDTFKVYTRTAEIHAANNKHDEAERMYSQLVRKLAGSKEAWLRYGIFLMQVERLDAARALMQRALRCLDRRDHVEVISKFAQLEFRFGEPERGRTMFDHLLSTYPKRLDQWNVYINQLVKSADYDAARAVFQRAETVHFTARRMRSLLKRHLEFEEAHGSEEQRQAVREAARQYVESQSAADAVLLDSEGR